MKRIQLWEKADSDENRKVKDEAKMKECSERGITLIQIPYWWNRTDAQLIQYIRSYRPDLLLEYNDINPSKDLQLYLPKTEEIKLSLMSSMLFRSTNYRGWYSFKSFYFIFSRWLSEKYNGIKVVWDGISLHNKNGEIIKCDPQFLQSLPKDVDGQVDGQLLSPVNETAEIINYESVQWNSIKFLALDILTQGTFLQRYKKLQDMAVKNPQTMVDFLHLIF